MEEMSTDEVAGKAIALYRFAADQMTQSELADRLGKLGIPTAQQTIAKIETGKRPLKLSEAVAVAEVLGVKVGDLLDTDSGVSNLFIGHLSTELIDGLTNLETATWTYGRARVHAAALIVRMEREGPLADDVAALKRLLLNRKFRYDLESEYAIRTALEQHDDERTSIVELLGLPDEYATT
ncbi:helix-turn-helix transcriptional regulator [Gordonia sp. TBRC 11910]|uniref:Helix-turn-helix transcriptional regulator n=1 Tax=Gordonia asplenii TaxID=2725283 RepID=A0A848KWU6_9ACTN|nr:helix-turn-helix transcriptional regulator [Gordonia asplenii]NMO03116.1 helix-turn-helix transcriptional regulator [Gordonia asplenii]